MQQTLRSRQIRACSEPDGRLIREFAKAM